MASGPITSWEIDGESMEIETDFICEDSKITDKSYCSLKIKTKNKKHACSLEEKLLQM